MSYSQEYILKKYSDARHMHGDTNHDILYNSKIWKYLICANRLWYEIQLSYYNTIKYLVTLENVNNIFKIKIKGLYTKYTLKKKLSIYWEYLSLKFTV